MPELDLPNSGTTGNRFLVLRSRVPDQSESAGGCESTRSAVTCITFWMAIQFGPAESRDGADACPAMRAIEDRKAVAASARPEPASIRLEDAVLCLSCEVLYAGTACPKCGDRFGWLVERWLAPRVA